MAEGASSQLATITSLASVEGPHKSKSYLWYGPPGVGKSTLFALHPGKKKLALDMDDKMTELEHLTTEQRTRIEIWRNTEPLYNPNQIDFLKVDRTRKDPGMFFDTVGPEPQGYNKLRKMVNELLVLAKKPEPFPYDAVSVDSLTRVNDHLISLILHHHKVTQMTETLWGVFYNNINSFINGFLRLPCDRIVIAHDKRKTLRDRDGNTLEDSIKPMVYGQMDGILAQFFSEVYYFLGRSPDGKYKIQIYADKIKSARTSKPHLMKEKESAVELVFS